MAGRSLPHAVLMMIPEPWSANPAMDPGGARLLRVPLVADGAVGRPRLDRLHRRHADRRRPRPQRPAPVALLRDQRRPRDHGLRDGRARHPARAHRAARTGCTPARCCWSTRPQGRIVDDEEIKRGLAARASLRGVAQAHLVDIEAPARRPAPSAPITRPCCAGSRPSATPQEDLRVLLTPMALTGEEPIGSMGTDTALAVLSDRPRLLYDYFTQLFAQVTNPPLDAIREELVTSMGSTLGPGGQPAGGRRPRPAARSRSTTRSSTTTRWRSSATCRRDRPSARPRCRCSTTRMRMARAGAGDGRAVPQGQPGGGGRLRHPDPLGPRRRCRRTRRSRACSRPPACTITWSARAAAPGAGCSSRPATRARCTTWRCSSATAPAR